MAEPSRDIGGRRLGEEMDESAVVSFLGRKINSAMNDEDGDLSDVREENFNYYTGQEYGTERDGYSKYVTREAFETVEWVLPSVLRVFLSGDKIVVFEPNSEEDEESSKQETDITNYFVMKVNKNGEGGFLSLHHWMKDALMYPNGYIKVYMEEKEHTDVGVVTGLNEMGVQMIVDDDEVEIIEQRSRMIKVQAPPQQEMAPQQPPPQGAPPQQGMAPQQGPPQGPPLQNVTPFPPPEMEVEVFDLKIRTTKKVMELRIDPVPPEEALIDNDCTTPNLDEADFVCHRVQKTFTDLVNEGHDPDELDAVGTGENHQWNDERTNRLFYEDEDPDAEDEDDPSMRQFWVHDCYAWFDYTGVGTAQHRHVVLIGDKIFENEETNYQPLISLSAILMQHKHTGMSYIDIMKELQLLSSTLTRQLLDNVYKINVRRKVFSEDALTEDGSTMEAILNTQAEFIPVRGVAQNAFVPEPTQSIIGELLPVIQHFSETRAARTGVTPEAQIDANALQEVRQEVFSNAMDRASQRIEMLVRIFAETGYRQLMLKVHQLLRSHWDVARTVKLRGKWVDVDPQGWRNRSEMTINVGLGFSTKQQKLGVLAQLLSMQKEAAAEGLADLPKIYNTLEKLVNASDIGDIKQYFVDPESPEFTPPQPAPDPNMILAQAQAEALKSEQERKGMEAQSKAQMDEKKTEYDWMMQQEDLKGKGADRELKMRELALKELELERTGKLAEGELMAKVENIQADTKLKQAQAEKAQADAAETSVELTETYKQAVKVVAEGNALKDDGSTNEEFKRDETGAGGDNAEEKD